MNRAFILPLLAVLNLPVHAALDPDDFLPPLQAKTPEEQAARSAIQGPVEMEQSPETGETTVTATSAQDAINHVVQQRSAGCEMIKFPSGFGWVATGTGTYQVMDNPTATRSSKRGAYVRAFMASKANLAQCLDGLNSRGQQLIVEAMEQVTDAREDLFNFSTTQQERLEQAVVMMLRGFVVYSLEDVVDEQTVFVSIVTTPKTRGQFNRPAHDAIEAESVRDGLQQVFSEIEHGLVPPIGGKTIAVKETGEMAFIGFGSHVIGMHRNPAMQTKINMQANRIAQMRAADALVGLIIGDDTRWKGKIDSETREAIEDFARDGQPDGTLQRFEQTRETFLSTLKSSDEYASFRSGKLPPGVMQKTFRSTDDAEVYAVAVYIPSVTRQATNAARDMEDAQLLEPSSSSGRKDQIFSPPAGTVRRPSAEVRQGPTGVVSPKDDL